DDPERLLRKGLVRWHKRSARCRVAEVAFETAPARGLTGGVLKCIEPRRDWRRLLVGFRFAPVRRAWEMGHALRRRGIDTPCPILFVERWNGSVPTNYLLTERIDDGVNASEFFRTAWPSFSAAGQRQWLAGRLGRLAV